MRVHHLAAALSLSLLAPLATGCPGEEESEGADLDALRAAVQGWIERCQSDRTAQYAFALALEPETYAFVNDLDGALERQYESLFDDLVENPNIVVNEEAIPGCIESINASTCEGGAGNDGGCEDVFQGVAEEGAVCGADMECVSGHCSMSEADDCGACAPAVPAGGECSLERADGSTYSATCADGLRCDFVGNECVVPGGVGQPCGAAGGACEQGLYCSGENTCAPVPGLGESCEDSGYCQGELRCSADDICAVEPAPPKAGDACDPAVANACGSPFVSGLVCAFEGEQGVCESITIVEVGGACDGPLTTVQPSTRWCKRGLSQTYCAMEVDATEGTCEYLPGPGEDCHAFRCRQDQAACVSEDGAYVCVAAPGDGEVCLDEEASVSVRCQVGLTCRGEPFSEERCEPTYEVTYEEEPRCWEVD